MGQLSSIVLRGEIKIRETTLNNENIAMNEIGIGFSATSMNVNFFWLTSVTRLGNSLYLGNFLKPLATINLPISPTFLGIFCKGCQNLYYFLVKSFLGNFYRHLATFTGHTAVNTQVRLFLVDFILINHELRRCVFFNYENTPERNPDPPDTQKMFFGYIS